MSPTRPTDAVVDLTPLIEAIGTRPPKRPRTPGRPGGKPKPPQASRRQARAAQVQDDGALLDAERYGFGALVAKLNEVLQEK